MRSTSALLFVLLALCFLGLCESSRRSKRTKTRGNNRAHCQLPPDPGSCASSKLRRWFYDPATGSCRTFFWTECDGNDNRFRSSRQCERSCKVGQSEDDATPVAKCRRLPCKGLDCHHGYERGIDDNGCQTCQCRSLPTMTTTEVPVIEVCPQVDCPGVFCPSGMQLDGRGCLTCRCLGCPPLECPPHLNCHDGYVVDEQTGCERCECRERAHPVAAETLPVTEKVVPVSTETLPVTEKVVPATTESSLPESSPEATSCPLPLQCFLQCSEGYAVDPAGCELCACREEDANTAPLGDDGGQHLCRPVECDISCAAGGYRTDENGCEICSCTEKDENENEAERMRKNKKNCPKISCSSKCATKTDDKTGCPVCACNDDDVTTECDAAALVTCSLYCPGGYDRDSRGCEICDCRPLADEKSPPDVVTGGVVTCAPFNDVLCAEKCERFYISYDEHGCEECVCIGDEPPEFTTPVLHEYGCPALFDCTLECPDSSLERDERGCEICMCRKPEVDDWLKETRPEVTQEEEDGEAQTTAVTCPWLECGDDTCPDGYRVDAETGCPSCACVDDRQTGSAIDATSSDPYANVNRDSDLFRAEFESQEPNPTASAEWSDAMPDAPTTLDAPVTEVTDSPEPEGSSTTMATYPAEVMCSGKSCNKICINGLQRRKGEEEEEDGEGEDEEDECYICECNPEPRMEKRLVDVSIFNSRKGLCSLQPYKGPCRAILTRWNFNSQTGTCETFEYGGCRGNANNFRSKESCMEFCSAEVNQERATRQEWVKEVLGF